MAGLKTQENEASVTAFLESVEHERRRRDSLVVQELMARITGCAAKMWGASIVGFGRYHYRNVSGREGAWFLTGFSPRKQALTLYIMPGFGDYDALMGRLGKHKTGRSCLYVNKLADIDLATLEELIERSVDWMRQKYGA